MIFEIKHWITVIALYHWLCLYLVASDFVVVCLLPSNLLSSNETFKISSQYANVVRSFERTRETLTSEQICTLWYYGRLTNFKIILYSRRENARGSFAMNPMQTNARRKQFLFEAVHSRAIEKLNECQLSTAKELSLAKAT